MKRCTENSVDGWTHQNYGDSEEGKISSREKKRLLRSGETGSWYRRRHLSGTLNKQVKEPVGAVLSVLFTVDKSCLFSLAGLEVLWWKGVGLWYVFHCVEPVCCLSKTLPDYFFMLPFFLSFHLKFFSLQDW